MPVWAISVCDAELHITSQTAGNGVTTTQALIQYQAIQKQRADASKSLVSLDYRFESIGNLEIRKDNNQWFNPERFCYSIG